MSDNEDLASPSHSVKAVRGSCDTHAVTKIDHSQMVERSVARERGFVTSVHCEGLTGRQSNCSVIGTAITQADKSLLVSL